MQVAESGLIALLVGFALGMVGRQLLRSRVRVSVAEATLSGIVGAVIGGGLASLIASQIRESTPLITGIGSVVGTVAVLLVVDRFAWLRRHPARNARELIAGGESSGVEFKSTARYNLHSKQRDEKLEMVIVKTIAAFANKEGGVLLIGVTDEGQIYGLTDDFKFMKAADTDRYELWLRDLLITTIGVVAASDVVIEFEVIDGSDVCVVRVPPATRPVVVSSKGSTRAIYVRSGNSTRELQVDEALAYSAKRWRSRTLRNSLR